MTQSSFEQLWALLPEVYRERDRESATDAEVGGHLQRYLHAYGHLFDLLRSTLDQRLADCFPMGTASGEGTDEREPQDWLLPYFARLLDVDLLSPLAEGQRLELEHAIEWRQRKGTVGAVENIAESVGQLEVELQEGWTRVAVTFRVDRPLIPDPEVATGEDGQIENRLDAARHRDLPVVTVDTRFASRAVKALPGEAFARRTTIGGVQTSWRYANPHGVPCFPGSYEDASVRTVDVRNPDARRGHAYPKRTLLFAPPEAGYFVGHRPVVQWSELVLAWDELRAGTHPSVSYRRSGGGGILSSVDGRVTVVGNVDLSAAPDTVSEIRELNLSDEVVFSGGTLHLHDCTIANLVRPTDAEGVPRVDAHGCVFGKIDVHGRFELDYCTVLEESHVYRLDASDCIFAGDLSIESWKPEKPCIRYSRVPFSEPRLGPGNTTDVPIFGNIDWVICEDVELELPEYPVPGQGVLHWACPRSIRAGAEHGGEMGAFHERNRCLRESAVIDKLATFLPVGIEPVWIDDPRLHHIPQDLQSE